MRRAKVLREHVEHNNHVDMLNGQDRFNELLLVRHLLGHELHELPLEWGRASSCSWVRKS
jgi:hypothetical protein